jgi:hypothetical protein
VSQKVINWLVLSACGGMGVAVIGYQIKDIELLTLGAAVAVVSTVTLAVYVFSRW